MTDAIKTKIADVQGQGKVCMVKVSSMGYEKHFLFCHYLGHLYPPRRMDLSPKIIPVV